MKASEARQLAKQADEATQKSEQVIYDKIMSEIRAALSKDECYEIWWGKSLTNRLISRLKADGYHISNSPDPRDSGVFKISWAEDGQ